MKAPGHRKHPQHQVREHTVDGVVVVTARGEVVARSEDVVVVEEDNHPPRYYFPPSDVHLERLQRTDKTTKCPFKGEARYFHLRTADETHTFENVVWAYGDPFDEHAALQHRLAFHDEGPDIEIRRE